MGRELILTQKNKKGQAISKTRGRAGHSQIDFSLHEKCMELLGGSHDAWWGWGGGGSSLYFVCPLSLTITHVFYHSLNLITKQL